MGDHGCHVQPNHHFEDHRAWALRRANQYPDRRGLTDEQVAWELNDELVAMAEHKFLPVWEHTRGNDGYVSFELDPLIDVATNLSHPRAGRYIELGRKW